MAFVLAIVATENNVVRLPDYGKADWQLLGPLLPKVVPGFIGAPLPGADQVEVMEYTALLRAEARETLKSYASDKSDSYFYIVGPQKVPGESIMLYMRKAMAEYPAITMFLPELAFLITDNEYIPLRNRHHADTPIEKLFVTGDDGRYIFWRHSENSGNVVIAF